MFLYIRSFVKLPFSFANCTMIRFPPLVTRYGIATNGFSHLNAMLPLFSGYPSRMQYTDNDLKGFTVKEES